MIIVWFRIVYTKKYDYANFDIYLKFRDYVHYLRFMSFQYFCKINDWLNIENINYGVKFKLNEYLGG